jgi:hypothetical protein
MRSLFYRRVLFSVVATVGIIAFSTPFFLVLIVPLGKEREGQRQEKENMESH